MSAIGDDLSALEPYVPKKINGHVCDPLKIRPMDFFEQKGHFYIESLVLDIDQYRTSPIVQWGDQKLTGKLTFVENTESNANKTYQVEGETGKTSFTLPTGKKVGTYTCEYDPDDRGAHYGHLQVINNPFLKDLNDKVQTYMECILSVDLKSNYWCETFYYEGSELKFHSDSDEDDITVSVNISSRGLSDHYTLCFFDVTYITKPGDAVLYNGKQTHWRDPIDMIVESDDAYFHQVNFHYVKK